MKHTLIALTTAIALQGCISSESAKLGTVNPKIALAFEECSYQGKNEYQTALQIVDCKFAKTLPLLKQSGYSQDDLVKEWETSYREIAQSLDDKKISHEASDQLFLAATKRFYRNTSNRDEAAIEALGAASDSLNYSRSNIQNSIPQPIMPIHCNSYGGYGAVTTNCY